MQCFTLRYFSIVCNILSFLDNVILENYGCVPLIWSGSGSVIRDHLDHGRSNEPMNPCPEWIHRFIWSTMIRVISDHWSWSGSSQRNAPYLNHEFYLPTSSSRVNAFFPKTSFKQTWRCSCSVRLPKKSFVRIIWRGTSRDFVNRLAASRP